jgi:hypothetical protein
VKRWVTKEDGWAELFTSYRETAFRWECQQVYCSPAEDADLANFLAGRPLDTDWSFQQRTSVPQRAAGRVKTRVRLVVEPPTPYTRYELAVFPTLQALGTDIRILAVGMGEWPDDLPHHDFWLFDDRDLWVMHYYENFRFAGAELVDEPAAVQQHRRWRDEALAQSVPLDDHAAGEPPERTTA